MELPARRFEHLNPRNADLQPLTVERMPHVLGNTRLVLARRRAVRHQARKRRAASARARRALVESVADLRAVVALISMIARLELIKEGSERRVACGRSPQLDPLFGTRSMKKLFFYMLDVRAHAWENFWICSDGFGT